MCFKVMLFHMQLPSAVLLGLQEPVGKCEALLLWHLEGISEH